MKTAILTWSGFRISSTRFFETKLVLNFRMRPLSLRVGLASPATTSMFGRGSQRFFNTFTRTLHWGASSRWAMSDIEGLGASRKLGVLFIYPWGAALVGWA